MNIDGGNAARFRGMNVRDHATRNICDYQAGSKFYLYSLK